MRIFLFLMVFGCLTLDGPGQTAPAYTSSELLLQLKKMDVLGSVLYIAAHPDDENTRMLAWLANEKLYRTGYLSLTRGDGGQNLIGDEQGVDLGLIRTQELLAARRIDGAEQFFTRAYDFGYCKTPEEALATWGHEKILGDVVRVIRSFRPDIIIARFPEDNRAGHGHHAASGILAREAFDAAADSTRFPEQFAEGLSIWQTRRLLWNTYNFGSANTQRDEQFKTDVGAYNPLLGKSYGEIAALSRSQHKSQGFGVPAQRGAQTEYFETIRGEKPLLSLMDGVDTRWERIGAAPVHALVEQCISRFNTSLPASSVGDLIVLYRSVQQLPRSYWRNQKLNELSRLIVHCSGVFAEAISPKRLVVEGDTMSVNIIINNRTGLDLRARVQFNGSVRTFDTLKANVPITLNIDACFTPGKISTQPYWLTEPMSPGSFTVTDGRQIGLAQNEPLSAACTLVFGDFNLELSLPLRYKYTDPVKGEIYQPVSVVPPFSVRSNPPLGINRTDAALEVRSFRNNNLFAACNRPDPAACSNTSPVSLAQEQRYKTTFSIPDKKEQGKESYPVYDRNGRPYRELVEINYDHIPAITYLRDTRFQTRSFDCRIAGKSVGYIAGAGDKVPQALSAMGYSVTMLKEEDVRSGKLSGYDAIVTGVRAYNTNDWMSDAYDALMNYVHKGGVLLVPYNTSNFISQVKSRIGPYDFSIGRNRITDEHAAVNWLLPDHQVMRYPNKLTPADFEGWVQERSIYHAEKTDKNYVTLFRMQDAAEPAQDGALIMTDYGKGRFIYTGLAFFRQLPAGVPGAYRLLANLLAR